MSAPRMIWREVPPKEYIHEFPAADKLSLDRGIEEVTQFTASNGKHPIRVELIEPWTGVTTHEAMYTLVRSLPLGSSASARECRFESWFIAQALDVPVVTVSAPSRTGRYKISLQDMSDPNFESYGRQAHEAVHSMGRRIGKMAFMGWSWGATASLTHAAYATRDTEVAWVAAGDPPNTGSRPPGVFLEAMKDGEALYKTLERTGLHRVFMQAYGFEDKKAEHDPQAFRVVMNRRLLKEACRAPWTSYKLALAISQASLATQVALVLEKKIPLITAHAAKSIICSKESLHAQLNEALRHTPADHRGYVQPLTFLEANHTHGSFVHAMAYLGRLGFKFGVASGTLL